MILDSTDKKGALIVDMVDVYYDVITTVGVVATAGFSFLVYKATKETANVAKATYDLNRDLQKRDEERELEFNSVIKKTLTYEIISLTQESYDKMGETNASLLSNKLHTLPPTLNISAEKIGKYFTKEEAEKILYAWNNYSDFRKKYLKTRYPDNTQKLLIDNIEPIKNNFKELLNLLKNI